MTFLDYIKSKSYNLDKFDKIYIKPNIPINKARNAISEYGDGVNYDDIVVLIDDTVFGSGKNGVLITEDGIYFKESFYDPDFFSFSKIEEVKAERKVFKISLLINSELVIELTQPAYKKTIQIISALNTYIHTAKPVENKPVENKPVENKPVENVGFPILSMADKYRRSNDDISKFLHQILIITGRLKINNQNLNADDLRALVFLCFDFHMFLFANKGLSKNSELAKIMILPIMALLEEYSSVFDGMSFENYAEELIPISMMNHIVIINSGETNRYIQEQLFDTWREIINDLDFNTYVDTLDHIKKASMEYIDSVLKESIQTQNKLNSLLD